MNTTPKPETCFPIRPPRRELHPHASKQRERLGSARRSARSVPGAGLRQALEAFGGQLAHARGAQDPESSDQTVGSRGSRRGASAAEAAAMEVRAVRRGIWGVRILMGFKCAGWTKPKSAALGSGSHAGGPMRFHVFGRNIHPSIKQAHKQMGS